MMQDFELPPLKSVFLLKKNSIQLGEIKKRNPLFYALNLVIPYLQKTNRAFQCQKRRFILLLPLRYPYCSYTRFIFHFIRYPYLIKTTKTENPDHHRRNNNYWGKTFQTKNLKNVLLILPSLFTPLTFIERRKSNRKLPPRYLKAKW